MSPTRIFSLCFHSRTSPDGACCEPGASYPQLDDPAPYRTQPRNPVEVTGKVEKALALLTKVGAHKVEIQCTAAKFVDALLEVSGGASGKLHYEGCTTKLNGGGANGACKPHSPGATEG